jgi:hypothetical protein
MPLLGRLGVMRWERKFKCLALAELSCLVLDPKQISL